MERVDVAPSRRTDFGRLIVGGAAKARGLFAVLTGRSCAWPAAAILIALSTGSVFAEDVPGISAPAVTAVDANGVDLISGQWSSPAPSMSIGTEGSGLSNSFAGFAAFASSWYGRVGDAGDGSTYVTVGNSSEAFVGNSPRAGGASTLTGVSENGKSYTLYTTEDGTRYYFDDSLIEYKDWWDPEPDPYDPNPPAPRDPPTGPSALAKVIKPDGEVITVENRAIPFNSTYTVYLPDTPLASWQLPEGSLCRLYTVDQGTGTVPCPPCDEFGEPPNSFPDMYIECYMPLEDPPEYTIRVKSQVVQLIGAVSSLGWRLSFDGTSYDSGAKLTDASAAYCGGVGPACTSLAGPRVTSVLTRTNVNGERVATREFIDALNNKTTLKVYYSLRSYDLVDDPQTSSYRATVSIPTMRSVETARGAKAIAAYEISDCAADYANRPTYSWNDTTNKARVSAYQLGDAYWTYTYSCVDNHDDTFTITSTVTHSGGTAGEGTRTVVARGTPSYSQILSDTDELNRTTSYEYYTSGASIGALKKVIRPGGSTPGYTEYEYNTAGDLTKVKDVPAGGGTALETTATYVTCDAQSAFESNFRYCHKPSSVTDPNGVTTTFTYYWQHGGLKTVTSPAVNSVAAQTRYFYDDFTPQLKNSAGALVDQDPVWRLISVKKCATGNLDVCVDPVTLATDSKAEAVTEFSYSLPHVLPVTKTTKRGDGSLSQTVTTAYDSVGNVESVDGPISGTDDTSYAFYDAVRRKVGEIGPKFDASGGTSPRLVTHTTYGADGQVEMVELGSTTATPSLTAVTGITPRETTKTTYSAATSKPLVTRRYDGSTLVSVAQVGYDAALRTDCVAQRMAVSNWTTVPSTLPDACVAQTVVANDPDRIVKTAYDKTGKVLKTTSGYGLPSPYSSVQRDDRVDVYNSTDGTLTSSADANGNLTTYEYDGFLRLKKTLFPKSSGPGSSTTDYEETLYTGTRITEFRLRGYNADPTKKITTDYAMGYDAVGRVKARGGAVTETFAYNNLGAVTSHSRTDANSGVHTSTFAYNSLGWLLSETTSALGTVSYAYDAYGRRQSLTWPDAFSVDYAYNAANALTDISRSSVSLVTFGYDAAGRRASVSRTNGVTTSYTYDGVSRLTGLTQDLTGTTDDFSLTFAYNPASQLKSIVSSAERFGPAALPTSSVTYGIDGLNRVTSTTGPSTVYGYDARGNLTTEGSPATSTYSYDTENRLTGLTTSGGSATLSYDAQGRLFKIVKGGVTTQMLYDGVNLIAEYNGSGSILRRYVHGPGTDEPMVWYEGGTADANRRWLHANHQGSIIAVTNNSGGLLAANTYDEYGLPGGLNTGRFQYTGQQWIGEVGLYHYKARAYSPAFGRFMQTDPVGYKDGMNWYAYVGNDPINKGDPTGLQALPFPMPLPPPVLPGAPPRSDPLSDLRQLADNIRDGFRKFSERSQNQTESQTRRSEEYVVRLQVQGTSITQGSVPIQRNEPVTAKEAQWGLTLLLNGLTPKEMEKMAPAFLNASRFIDRAAAGGGVGPIGSQTFRVPGINPSVARVDVEIMSGPINLVP